MSGLLDEICAAKRDFIADRSRKMSRERLAEEAGAQSPPRGFIDSLRSARAAGRFGLVCELKRRSPSAGELRPDYDPPALARAYAAGGAACLSVLTDASYFGGRDSDLKAARKAVDLPVLRKDFILDPYQVTESRAIGADCILLILAVLARDQAAELESEALDLGLDVLLEVHDEAELALALSLQSRLIGINNRHLDTLEVDLGTSRRLAELVPDDRLLVAESGLARRDDLIRLEKSGIGCFLIGEALMRAADPGAATRALAGDARHGKTVASR